MRRSESPIMEINFTSEELIKIRANLQNSTFLKNYKDYIKRPGLVGKMLYCFLRDKDNLFETLKKFNRTKRIDDLAEGILKSYRISLRE